MKLALLSSISLAVALGVPQASMALDLKKESQTNNACVRFFPSKPGGTPNDDPIKGVCITSKNRVIYRYNVVKWDLGIVGKAENDDGTIIQFEIENGMLKRYRCNAKDMFSMQCTDEVKISTWIVGQGFRP